MGDCIFIYLKATDDGSAKCKLTRTTLGGGVKSPLEWELGSKCFRKKGGGKESQRADSRGATVQVFERLGGCMIFYNFLTESNAPLKNVG